jgi:hypothetical protein
MRPRTNRLLYVDFKDHHSAELRWTKRRTTMCDTTRAQRDPNTMQVTDEPELGEHIWHSTAKVRATD